MLSQYYPDKVFGTKLKFQPVICRYISQSYFIIYFTTNSLTNIALHNLLFFDDNVEVLSFLIKF